jgi:hypothetical protein
MNLKRSNTHTPKSCVWLLVYASVCVGLDTRPYVYLYTCGEAKAKYLTSYNNTVARRTNKVEKEKCFYLIYALKIGKTTAPNAHMLAVK